MGALERFRREFRRQMRSQGVYLDAAQALAILKIARAAPRAALSVTDAAALEKFTARCSELEGAAAAALGPRSFNEF